MQILYKGDPMSNKLDEVKEANIDLEKREFMGKVGKYAAVGAGMATLMTPTLSTAGNYQSPDDNSVHYPTTENHDGDNWKDADRADGEGNFIPPGQT